MTARGCGTGLDPKGPAKVKAHKSILFTDGAPEVEISLQCRPCMLQT